jgi:hypothetical protein
VTEERSLRLVASSVAQLRIRQVGIRTRHRAYNREASRILTLSVPAVPAGSPGSWLGSVVEVLAEQSSRLPLEESRVGRATHAFNAACTAPELEQVWSRTLGELSRDDLDALFNEIESRLESDAELSESMRYHGSLQFRRACALLIPQLRSDLHLTGFKFRSRFVESSRPRALISDQVVDGSAPLGAIPYDNPRELKKKMLDTSLSVLTAIKSAAASDLDAAARLRDLLDVLKAELNDDTYVDAVRRATRTKQYSTSSYKLVPYDNPRRYIGALVHVHDQDNWPALNYAVGVLYGRQVDRFLLNEVGWNVTVARPLRMRSFATLQEVHACTVILQIVSSWNISAILDLRLEDIVKVKGGYVIQSFKSKTDTHTPPVRLTEDGEAPHIASEVSLAKEPEACRALELLIWNHKQLVAHGCQDANDTRLINSAFAYFDQPGSLTIQHYLEEFISRHALPRFSTEQLRNETLFATSLGNLANAQRDADHKSIATTGNYIRQQVAKRLHSSQNLQFQRQFAAEIRALQARQIKRTELKLLRPIGDGASCIDPASHPWLDIYEKECPGDRCHSNGGCANRVIRVTRQRIKEALLTERVYLTNWQDLCEQNPAAFLEYDVPRIIFVKGFLHMTSESTLGHVVTKLRRELNSESK